MAAKMPCRNSPQNTAWVPKADLLTAHLSCTWASCSLATVARSCDSPHACDSSNTGALQLCSEALEVPEAKVLAFLPPPPCDIHQEACFALVMM